LEKEDLFVVAFTAFMDETAEQCDLVFPIGLPLEVWDEYAGRRQMLSTLQPAMGRLTDAPDIGDVCLALQADSTGVPGGKPPADYRGYLYDDLRRRGACASQTDWLQIIRCGGRFDQTRAMPPPAVNVTEAVGALQTLDPPVSAETVLIAAPSLRFFDGRGANRSWLCEIPDPLSKIAWQTPLFVHPQTLAALDAEQGDLLEVTSPWGGLQAPAYESAGVRPNVVVMPIGQGHAAYGRYARGQGLAPGALLPPQSAGDAGAPCLAARPVQLAATGRSQALAHTDGSRIQHGRKIALTVDAQAHTTGSDHGAGGLAMHDFPLTLPLPEGYASGRDFYAPLQYKDYRWAMAVDLDRCIGCGACAAACYAENNIGIVGEAQVLNGREMSWMRIDRYHDPQHPERIIFLPMMCQHCDNAPCESVCPVYAPHHNAEGMNNQIYNRCIGTRFCAQNCPYKVRRFNWFSWPWPEPLHYQLNPDVTVRSKGVMEKCSFCVQRIKEAHGIAKNEKRPIADGEVVPACVQTCPTGALVFGNLLDPASRVRRLADDARAYQVMGYLNTKPAVIYLKKVRQEI
jgi:molybdopterin-containing oxidoreductase family iron-sulfur binding subunit